MININRENILSYFLAFVFFYFGYQELVNTQMWISLVPGMLTNILPATTLVFMHGLALVVVGLALVFNLYRRIASIIAGFMLLDVVVVLMIGDGFSATAVRDIGLLGIAVALSIKE